MAIARPTPGIVPTVAWGNPITDEINSITTKSKDNVTAIDGLEVSLDDYLDAKWQTLPLATGWSAYGSSQVTPQYAVFGKWAYLRGLVKNTSGAAATGNKQWATGVPSEVVPPLHLIVPVLTNTSHAIDYSSARVTIQSNGTWNIIISATYPIANNGWFSLEGIGWLLW